MLRLFDTHKIRKTKELNGLWDFKRQSDDSFTYKMPVPGAWETHPDFLNYRGCVCYRKKIETDKTANLRFDFKGVSHTADIYFDGKKTAHHYNAYTPFQFVAENVSQGEHELLVFADNSYGEASALHIPNDYYTYGGITRGVCMEEVGSSYIERMHFTPELCGEQWKAVIEVVVTALSADCADVCIQLAGKELKKEQISLMKGENKILFEAEFENVRNWCPDAPELYRLSAVLIKQGMAVDDLIERVGFRTVAYDKNGIYINGRKIFLKGFNRHESYASVGSAIPFQLMAQDLQLMIDMNANAVRCSHYPNDELFLDLCDECGILVWEENHSRVTRLEDMQNPNFDRQCEDCNREMIDNHYNHPSIVIWGILNEGASETQEGREKYSRQFAQIRSMDQSRPVTFATCRHFTDICLDLPDIVSWNLYTGWAFDGLDIAGEGKREIDWSKAVGGEGKPVIISEFGAGAVYGFRDPAMDKWSEERQCKILEDSIHAYTENPDVCGMFIWQFSDCRVDEQKWSPLRPKTRNNKGVVDEYRRRKLAYETVKKCFGEI